VGEFYSAIKCPLYHLPEGGTVEKGIFEVDRWIDHHREHGDVEFAMRASTLVSSRVSGRIVAVCLVNVCEPFGDDRKFLHLGASVQHIVVAPDLRRQGIATKMVQRALTVVADKRPRFDVWVEEDDEDERGLFESLDFVFTGVED
jgi:ribosomal protein S18 acetylase RimI-like enzyme